MNVSRADIYLVDVAAELHALVERYGIDPSLIEVEITESAYSERPDRIVAAFDELAERGFTVLMDDFGSGYSSLNMLKDINVDVLKIEGDGAEAVLAEAGFAVLAPEEVYCVDPA